LTPFTYAEPAVAEGAFLFLGVNAAFLAGGALRIRALEFAPEQRSGVRLPVTLRGTVDGAVCTVDDLSLSGAGVTLPAGAPVSGHVELVVLLPDHTVTLQAAVRRRRETGGGVELGLEFDPAQVVDIADLALALLSTDVAGLGAMQWPAPYADAAPLELHPAA
jgi:hypothetical protein